MSEWRQAKTAIQRYPRVSESMPVRISTVEPERDPTTGKLFFRSSEETTANLSQGGAFVRSWEPLEAGRNVVVDIDLPSGERIQLVARVAWTQRQLRSHARGEVDSPGYGIEFSRITGADLERLDRYLDGRPARSENRSSDTSATIPAAP